MNTYLTILLLATAVLVAAGPEEWPIHDRNRPAPKAVDPGTASTQEQAGRPPADAVVLFDGKDLSRWRTKKDGAPPRWKVEGGYFEVVKDTGDIETVQGFGSCQLHLEWRTPAPPVGQDQDRGNSGVYLQDRYEVQVLDSFGLRGENNECGGIYTQAKPSVNMCFPPLTWQTYDIDFTSAQFDADGKKTKPAIVTVKHNGVTIHDKYALKDKTGGGKPEGPSGGAIQLQGHGNPVFYRNVWIVEK